MGTRDHRRDRDRRDPTGPDARGLDRGEPLDGRSRRRLEAAYGTSLESVRIHDGPRADDLARRHAAAAFTFGQDIVFSHGAYRPGTIGGDALIAHEVAHAVQQRTSGEAAVGLMAPDARLEGEAGRAAAAVIARDLSGSQVVVPPIRQGRGLQISRCPVQEAPTPNLEALPRWMREAGVDVNLHTAEGARQNIFQLNRSITAAYARMYLRDPETYRWAGMAAYASDLVGSGMFQATQTTQMGPAGSVYQLVTGTPTGAELLAALRAGNIGVYRDIYWQHLAYEHGGLEELERSYVSQEIPMPERVIEAWRTIDRGRTLMREAETAGDSAMREQGNDLVWEGNAALLRYEQEETLQKGVYDHHRSAFEWLSSGYNIAGIASPIPGHDATFGQDVPDGDIGNFGDRWRWIAEHMLPAWRELAENDPEQVRADMERFAAGGG
jgi:hypothetical protein